MNDWHGRLADIAEHSGIDPTTLTDWFAGVLTWFATTGDLDEALDIVEKRAEFYAARLAAKHGFVDAPIFADVLADCAEVAPGLCGDPDCAVHPCKDCGPHSLCVACGADDALDLARDNLQERTAT